MHLSAGIRHIDRTIWSAKVFKSTWCPRRVISVCKKGARITCGPPCLHIHIHIHMYIIYTHFCVYVRRGMYERTKRIRGRRQTPKEQKVRIEFQVPIRQTSARSKMASAAIRRCGALRTQQQRGRLDQPPTNGECNKHGRSYNNI